MAILHGIQSLCVLFSVLLIGQSRADTPANCTYEDVRGTWIFSVGPGNNERSVNCSSFKGSAVSQVKIELVFPDIAVDEFNNKGFWTIIYNQGFEVTIAGRKYFAFSKYGKNASYCDKTMPGWSHDIFGRDWACYTGAKVNKLAPKFSAFQPDTSLRFGHMTNSAGMIRSINEAQNSWVATHYAHLEHLSDEDMIAMVGGRASRTTRINPAPVTDYHHRIVAALPESFDWRNKNGINYVSPVRNQGACGSCYSFASLAMNEARVRLLTNNTQQPVFSPQDIVECSEYSQGCEGGFPYLIGGKYAEDFGLVEEKCNPYKGSDGKCKTDPKCARHYSTQYRYVGGYYGACNEPLMMQAIYERGPVAIGFEVYKDFMNYKSGVYHHTFGDAVFKFSPFEITNHAVLVVGWGTAKETGEKYWIVKNSWGTKWGLDGYFHIKRGNDECGLESMAVEASPIYTNNA